MNVDLAGRMALVTGASRGLGLRMATTLASRGAHVVLAARRASQLEDVAGRLAAIGGSATTIELDVTRAERVEAALSALPPLDIVVNNAGIAGPSRALDCSEDEWTGIYDVNVHGCWRVARCAARAMADAGVRGSIINIASVTGLRAAPGAAAYSSSKAAVIHMTRALANELARYGIRVNALAPGYFETDLNRDFLRSDHGKAMRARIPQRRFGMPSDLDGPLLLLASDASAYMTGSVIVVDGGHAIAPL